MLLRVCVLSRDMRLDQRTDNVAADGAPPLPYAMLNPQFPLMGMQPPQVSAGTSVGSSAGPLTFAGTPFGYLPLPTPYMFPMSMNMNPPPYPYHPVANGHQDPSISSISTIQSPSQVSGAGSIPQTPRRVQKTDRKALTSHQAGRVIKRSSVRASSTLRGRRVNPIAIGGITPNMVSRSPIRVYPKVAIKTTVRDSTPIVTPAVILNTTPTDISQTLYQNTQQVVQRSALTPVSSLGQNGTTESVGEHVATAPLSPACASTALVNICIPQQESTSSTPILIDDSEEQSNEKLQTSNVKLEMDDTTTAANTPPGITSEQLQKLLSSQHWKTFHKVSLLSLVEIMANREGSEYVTWLRRLARCIHRKGTYTIYEVDGFLYEVDLSTEKAVPIDRREYDRLIVRLRRKCCGSEAQSELEEVGGEAVAEGNRSFLDLLDENGDVLPPDAWTKELRDGLEEENSSSSLTI